jgi:serine/threonine protein kinase
MVFPNALPVGTMLDRSIEIRDVLGAGGFGLTYRVHDHDLDKEFVYKEFFPSRWVSRIGTTVEPLGNSEAQENFRHFLERFRDEARVAARVDHPNLVKVHRYFPANGTGYFAMDWHHGETLANQLERQRKMTARDAVRLAEPLLDGLGQLHKVELIHRDVKPANIYLRRDGQPLLLDFGAARVMPNSHFGPELTVVLSYGYAPPEQYDPHGNQGPHTDIYALGAVMYRLLTGTGPLDAETRMAQSASERLATSCSRRAPPEVPRALCEVVDRAMALDIADRISDTQALRRALATAMTVTKPVGAQPARPTPRPASPDAAPAGARAWRAAAGGAVLATVAIASAAFWWPAPAHKPSSSIPQPSPRPPDKLPDRSAFVSPHAAPQPVVPQAAVAPSKPTVTPPPPVAALSPGEDLLRKVRTGLPAGDLPVMLALDPPRSTFIKGDRLSIRFSVKEQAHAVVFVYSADGSVTLLYPLRYDQTQPLQADAIYQVNVIAVDALGADTVHVLALRDTEDFSLLLKTLDARKIPGEAGLAVDRANLERAVASIHTRSLFTRRDSGANATDTKSGWGDATTAIITQASRQ